MSYRHPSINSKVGATYGWYFKQTTPDASETDVEFLDASGASGITDIPCGFASTITVWAKAVTANLTVKLYGKIEGGDYVQIGSTITQTAGTSGFTAFTFTDDLVSGCTSCKVAWNATGGGATSQVGVVLK